MSSLNFSLRVRVAASEAYLERVRQFGMSEHEEILLLDRLCGCDRPSVMAAGLLVAQALKKTKTVVITADAMGRVILLPPTSVKIISPHRIKDEELNQLEEDQALMIMASEGRTDEEMLDYFRRKEGT